MSRFERLKTLRISSFLVLLTFLGACKTQQIKSKNLYQATVISSIEAINLSEDFSRFSSKNDEILLSIFSYTFAPDSSLRMTTYAITGYEFDSIKTLFYPEIVVSTTSYLPTKLVVCLTEIDDDSTEMFSHEILGELIKRNGVKAFDGDLNVDSLIADNDFLGYADIPLLTRTLDTSYSIEGVHLLDRYEYKIGVFRKPFAP